MILIPQWGTLGSGLLRGKNWLYALGSKVHVTCGDSLKLDRVDQVGRRSGRTTRVTWWLGWGVELGPICAHLVLRWLAGTLLRGHLLVEALDMRTACAPTGWKKRACWALRLAGSVWSARGRGGQGCLPAWRTNVAFDWAVACGAYFVG